MKNSIVQLHWRSWVEYFSHQHSIISKHNSIGTKELSKTSEEKMSNTAGKRGGGVVVSMNYFWFYPNQSLENSHEKQKTVICLKEAFQ